MSESEKPLHVRVAEALGWTRVHYRDEAGDPPAHLCGDITIADQERMRWKGRAPDQMLVGAPGCSIIPRYDTDWSATGPLIEKYKIELHRTAGSWVAKTMDGWESGIGDTVPLAACDLILALAAAGKLKEAA